MNQDKKADKKSTQNDNRADTAQKPAQRAATRPEIDDFHLSDYIPQYHAPIKAGAQNNKSFLKAVENLEKSHGRPAGEEKEKEE